MLKKFEQKEEGNIEFSSYTQIKQPSKIPESSLRTLKNVIAEETKPDQIVYERVFINSLSQQKRDSYFLTEIYNIKSLIRRQQLEEDGNKKEFL